MFVAGVPQRGAGGSLSFLKRESFIGGGSTCLIFVTAILLT